MALFSFFRDTAESARFGSGPPRPRTHAASGTVKAARAVPLRKSATQRLMETYETGASLGHYGPFQVGFARSYELSRERDVRVSARALVPYWDRFEPAPHPVVSTRGELLRALAPFVAHLGVDVEARHIETVRLLSALAEVLYSDVDGRLIPWPRFVFLGEDPTFHPRYKRTHLVVLDPRGETSSEGARAEVGELVWLLGTRLAKGECVRDARARALT